MAKFFMISLGCAKNLVDSEIMLGVMEKAGWQLQEDLDDAQVLLIN
ncbi:MAG: 30S ribosomal protein S12 methylthiotransferase RimO, partial [Desulfobulbaceae bacterium]